MAADIYDQHKISFGNVSAYVITDAKGERVATIAFKYPRDGAGRLYAYVHWIGVSMVRGFANGCGYDKHTAACNSAAQKLGPLLVELPPDHPAHAFRKALASDGGNRWDHFVRAAGFNVMQAV
jgi:hypothetical protein